MYNPAPIFHFIEAKQARGQAVALVTIAAVSGSSARNPGTHMAVSSDGEWAGSLTGGCIEAAVAGEALSVLEDGVPRLTRFGQGSRFLDIRLPCGGSLDLLFSPIMDAHLGSALVGCLDARKPFALHFSLHDHGIVLTVGDWRFQATMSEDMLVVNHIPPMQLALIGQGVTVEILWAIGVTIGVESTVYSPHRDLVKRIHLAGGKAHWLKSVTTLPDFAADSTMAAVLILHEHEWDPPILAKLLRTKAFYVGAMGSNAAHAQRCFALKKMGVSDDDIKRICAPIGLIPSMRDPETLAVSIIAEIVAQFNQAFLTP